MGSVVIAVWGAVHMPPIEGRLIQTWMYERTHLDDNHYSHPIDFVPLVDLNLNKVSPAARLCNWLSSLDALLNDAAGFSNGMDVSMLPFWQTASPPAVQIVGNFSPLTLANCRRS